MTDNDMLSLGYAQRIRELVGDIVTGADGEDTFVERAGAVMTALVSETANCTASLTVTRGLDPDVLAEVTLKQFLKFYNERLETLNSHVESISVN